MHTNLLRANMLLNQTTNGKEISYTEVNATNRPTGRFLPEPPEFMGKSQMKSFHQLAAKMKADRERRTGQPMEDKSLGREYFMKR